MIRNLHNFFGKRLSVTVAALAFLAWGGVLPAIAQYRTYPNESIPIAVSNPTITPRPNAALPLDTEFTRSDGVKVHLGDFFDGKKKPVLLEMVYFSCPYLCGENQATLALRVREGLRSLKLGDDFEIVVVSIDPDDTSAIASARRDTYLNRMDRPASQKGFTYLTGTEENIKTLADAIGFGYRRTDDPSNKYLHSTGIFVCTPYGHLANTITDMGYSSDELHAQLLAAADGKIGSGVFETLALPCGAMRLNPKTGKYEANPWFWAGTTGALATMLTMGIFLGFLWRGEIRRKRSHIDDLPAPDQPADDNPETP